MTAKLRSDMFTMLVEAQDWLDEHKSDGAICPCCLRFDKVYKRNITISGVRGLASLYRATMRDGQGSAHHWRTFLRHVEGEFTKLAHLNLLSRDDPESTDKKTSGIYRIHNRGMRFIQGEEAIPAHILLYHNELLGVSQETKFIRDFWPTFDYRELMRGT